MSVALSCADADRAVPGSGLYNNMIQKSNRFWRRNTFGTIAASGVVYRREPPASSGDRLSCRRGGCPCVPVAADFAVCPEWLKNLLSDARRHGCRRAESDFPPEKTVYWRRSLTSLTDRTFLRIARKSHNSPLVHLPGWKTMKFYCSRLPFSSPSDRWPLYFPQTRRTYQRMGFRVGIRTSLRGDGSPFSAPSSHIVLENVIAGIVR